MVPAALRQALNALPVRERHSAYAQADAADPTETPELGVLWERASGADMAAKILDGLLCALPHPGGRARERAGLDDPLTDLEL